MLGPRDGFARLRETLPKHFPHWFQPARLQCLEALPSNTPIPYLFYLSHSGESAPRKSDKNQYQLAFLKINFLKLVKIALYAGRPRGTMDGV